MLIQNPDIVGVGFAVAFGQNVFRLLGAHILSRHSFVSRKAFNSGIRFQIFT
jgi:hypothetical protein